MPASPVISATPPLPLGTASITVVSVLSSAFRATRGNSEPTLHCDPGERATPSRFPRSIPRFPDPWSTVAMSVLGSDDLESLHKHSSWHVRKSAFGFEALRTLPQ